MYNTLIAHEMKEKMRKRKDKVTGKCVCVENIIVIYAMCQKINPMKSLNRPPHRRRMTVAVCVSCILSVSIFDLDGATEPPEGFPSHKRVPSLMRGIQYWEAVKGSMVSGEQFVEGINNCLPD